MNELTVGQVAYAAFNEGLPHDWSQLTEAERQRWETAAGAVCDYYDPDGELIDAEFEAEPNDSDDAEG